jgi:hypothetical protein
VVPVSPVKEVLFFLWYEFVVPVSPVKEVHDHATEVCVGAL